MTRTLGCSSVDHRSGLACSCVSAFKLSRPGSKDCWSVLKIFLLMSPFTGVPSYDNPLCGRIDQSVILRLQKLRVVAELVDQYCFNSD